MVRVIAISGDERTARVRAGERAHSVTDGTSGQGAARLLLWLDIASAKTAVERREKIRQLPVTVVTSASTDGRDGIVRSFVSGGKTRVKVFVPAVAAPAIEGAAGERPSGPAVWQEECYNGEPGPCATDQEMDDFAWVLAQSASEKDYQQGEYDAAYADYESYCNQNPWSSGCQSLEADQLAPSGPSACDAMFGCWGHAAAATGSLYTWGWAQAQYGWELRLAAGQGTRLAAGTVAGYTGTLVVAAFSSGWFVGSFIDCQFIAKMYSEPAY